MTLAQKGLLPFSAPSNKSLGGFAVRCLMFAETGAMTDKFNPKEKFGKVTCRNICRVRHLSLESQLFFPIELPE